MRRFLPASIVLLLLFSSLAQAATYYVATTGNDTNAGTQAQPFLTLQKGLAAAVNGDAVLVANGTYTGAGNTNLSFSGKTITLRSLGGAANCILDCEAAARAFAFTSGETAGTILEGVTIKNASFPGGGGILIQNASPTLRNCILDHCASDFGGALKLESGSPTLTNCLLTGNSAVEEGGALYLSGSGSITFNTCTFQNNRAFQSGGAIYSFDVSLTVNDCLFQENSVDNRWGGAILNNSPAAYTRCTFQSNAGFRAGGIFHMIKTLTLTDCKFVGNNAGESGGAFTNAGGTATLSQCTFTENSSFNGGAVYNTSWASAGGNTTLLRCRFERNSVGNGSGGAVETRIGTLNCTQCTFFQNSGDFGGAMFLDSTVTTLTHCLFRANLANKGTSSGSANSGGAITIYRADPIITNCLFVGNTAGSKGGVIYLGINSQPTLTNCTLTANEATTASGIWANDFTQARLTNCILWRNFGGEVSGGLTAQSSLILNYPGLTATPDVNGNLSADPLFVRPANAGNDEFWATADDDFGDLRLQAGSPCINRGRVTVNVPAFDLLGYPRNRGGLPDMGAYETGTTTTFNFYVDKTNGNDVNPGTAAAPVRTVNRALSLILTPFGQAQINIRNGNYGTDKPRFMQNVRLVNWGNTGQASIGKP